MQRQLLCLYVSGNIQIMGAKGAFASHVFSQTLFHVVQSFAPPADCVSPQRWQAEPPKPVRVVGRHSGRALS